MDLKDSDFPSYYDVNNSICIYIKRLTNTSDTAVRLKLSTANRCKSSKSKNLYFCGLCNTAWKIVFRKREKTFEFINGLLGLGVTRKTCPECNLPVL